MQKLLSIFLSLFVVCNLSAQQPTTIKLTQLETAQTPVGDANPAGQLGLSNTAGKQRYAYHVRVLDTCILYNPVTTPGVGQPPSCFVKKCGTDSLFYIDWNREAIFLGESLTIQQIVDSIAADTLLQQNWYTHNGTTTDLLRQALVKRSAWWRTVDSLGFLRWSNRPDNFNGSQFSVYQDSVVVDADTVVWSSTYNQAQQFHHLKADRTYIYADSIKEIVIGQFPNLPNINLDGTEKGFFYSPNTWGDVGIYNGDGTTGETGCITIFDGDITAKSELPSSFAQMRTNVSTNTSSASLSALYNSGAYGSNSFAIRSQATLNEEVMGMTQAAAGSNIGASNYLGYGSTGSSISRYIGRAWGVQTRIPISGIIGYDWLQVILPNDSLGNQVSMYNRSYYFPNDQPSATLADTSIIAWVGDGTNAGKNPIFMPLPSGGGTGTNWYNSNGTTTDNTRIATVTETATWLSDDAVINGVYPFRFELASGTVNEPEMMVWKFPVDSATLYQSDQELVLHSTNQWLFRSNAATTLWADSIIFEANSIESKTKARYLFGGTPNNSVVKRFDADAANAGEFLVSNGTDWVLSSGAASGYLLDGGNTTGATVTAGTNDANNVVLETNNIPRVTVTGAASTGGAVTVANTTANTATVQDVLTLQTNSTGTAAASFGGGILFQGESSTTDNRDMVRLSSIWTTATDASRASALVYSDVTAAGALTERMRFSSAGITAASNTIYTAGNNLIQIGTSTGPTSIVSTGQGSTTKILLSVSNSATDCSGTIGNTNFTGTSGDKYDWRMASGFAPTSGTGTFRNLFFNGTYNQTGGANGITGAILINPTLTAVADFRGLEIAYSNASAKGIYQTGALTTNNFVGKTHFGATTAPTDAIDVTGNVNLTTAGNKLKIATGSNASVGVSGAMTAGSITISTTAVTANSQIFLTHASIGGTQGILSVGTITAGTSFVINSSNAADTGTVNWFIIN